VQGTLEHINWNQFAPPNTGEWNYKHIPKVSEERAQENSQRYVDQHPEVFPNRNLKFPKRTPEGQGVLPFEEGTVI
jgi:hypothetical protein